jgi:hypothetical protein
MVPGSKQQAKSYPGLLRNPLSCPQTTSHFSKFHPSLSLLICPLPPLPLPMASPIWRLCSFGLWSVCCTTVHKYILTCAAAKFIFWGYNSDNVLLLRATQWTPYLWINPKWPICCVRPFVTGLLAPSLAAALVFPHCLSPSTLTQNRRKHQPLPGQATWFHLCLPLPRSEICPHPSCPSVCYAPAEYSLLPPSSSVAPSEKPWVAHGSQLITPCFAE